MGQGPTGEAGRGRIAGWTEDARFWAVVDILLGIGAAAALLLLLMVGT